MHVTRDSWKWNTFGSRHSEGDPMWQEVVWWGFSVLLGFREEGGWKGPR